MGLGIFDHLIWLIYSNYHDSKGSPRMTIWPQIVSLLLLWPIVFSPSTSTAWFFSSAQAQEIESPISGLTFTKSTDLLVSALSMASDLKPGHNIDLVFDHSDAMAAEIGAMGTIADIIDIPANDTISVYTVASGDTLSSIAEKFNVSQGTIIWANNLTPKSTLRIGQSLTILPITGVRHTVVRGDTISTIARKYNADSREIANYNGIDTGDVLAIGTVIIVPAGEITSVPQVTSAISSQLTGSGLTGTVAPQGYYGRPITLTGDPRIRKTQGFHDRDNAVDVGAPIGTAILAMADGVVLVTRSVNAWNGGYGGFTAIQHDNGSQTIYAHQSKIIVSPGERVVKGQKIGEVGSTGRSTGPHLHFAIHGVKPTPVLY